MAKPVSRQNAESVAMKFLDLHPKTRVTDPIHLIWTGEPMTRVGDSDPAFYVFGRGNGGFVIVAGDDCLLPILGYSDESDFIVGKMPENIAGWFSSLNDIVKQIRREGVRQSVEIHKRWNSISTRSTVGIMLQTALWDQTSPYNLYAPMLRSNGTERCNIGCTNTATAIIMRYHELPEKGLGTLPDYTYTKGSYTRAQSGHSLGHIYDWDNMPTSGIKESSSSYKIKQVAQLMYDCAIMNKCKWNPYNSDTDPRNIPYALTTYMGYDKTIQYLERVDYASDAWEEMIRRELDEGRPIIYAGQREDGNGHSWVIDGYNSDGFFYMNWGWSGAYNGFFVISPLEKAANNYTKDHSMIIGIKPDEGGEPIVRDPYLVGSSTSNWRFNLNKSFISVFHIKNDGLAVQNLKCRVALTDKKGNLKSYLSDPIEIELPGFNTTDAEIQCMMKSMPENDDLIVLFVENNGEWKAMVHSDETVIKMKGPSPIEECTTISFSKDRQILTITTEKDNAIQVYYTESAGRNFIRMSQQNSGENSFSIIVPNSFSHDYSPYDLTVHIFNIAESKKFRVKLKEK